jgi:hypothetical protein
VDIRSLLLVGCCLSPPAAMGSSLSIMITKRAGKVECNRVVKWNAISHGIPIGIPTKNQTIN